MAGTPGAEVIRELEPRASWREFQCPKRAYGAFDGTELHALDYLKSVYGARIVTVDELVHPAEVPRGVVVT